MVRLLLDHGATLWDDDLEAAAQGGHWDLIMTLVDEYGADLNAGNMPPIVWAVQQERADIILKLLERGAELGEDAAYEAVRLARNGGLENMLVLLEGYGVEVMEVLQEVNVNSSSAPKDERSTRHPHGSDVLT